MSDLDDEVRHASSLFSLAGRVAVVTGASSGLGRRFAQVLHRAGATVVLAARRADRLESLAAELPGSMVVVTDVEVDSSLVALADRVGEAHGGIDVLVNNAGLGGARPALGEAVDDFRRIVEVNLISLFRLSQLAALQMVGRGGGSIVNVASIWGLVGGGLPLSAYSASKGGVISLTRDLANEWAEHGVRVNSIAPGWFPTEMTQHRFADDEKLQWICDRTPLGRGGREDELDGVLLFLASDASSYVTGQTIAVDGGWTSR
jgi:NAD(P)-dependent dehydrogenase (short-subunit alcohol dehydrogenase family)